MKIILCDRSAAVADAWRTIGLDAQCASIFDCPADAIVSPANSFGFMDGGIDLAYSQRFGWQVQSDVQDCIKRVFDGELLIGQALSVNTGDMDFPTLISAPTMRIPMTIPDPNHIRMATRAAVKEALRIGAKSVAIPGMGAGCGQVRPEWVACMMKAGIEDALDPKSFPKSLNDACTRHWAVKP